MNISEIEALMRNHVHRGEWLKVIRHYLERAELSLRNPINDRADVLAELAVVRDMLELTEERVDLVEKRADTTPNP